MKNEFHLYAFKLLPYPELVFAPFIYLRSILSLTITPLNLKEISRLNFYIQFKKFSRDLKGDESDLRNRVRFRRSPAEFFTYLQLILIRISQKQRFSQTGNK